MASMRVHELAKEFGMNSTELLARLQEMKIPAKSHSSTLVDAYVDRIRKKLGPEIAQRAAEAEAAKAEEEAVREIEEQRKREEEEAARKAAVDAERRMREAERIEREAREAEEAEALLNAEVDEFQPALVETLPKPIPRFSGLLSQIEAERNRLEAEKKAKQEAKRQENKNRSNASAKSGARKASGGLTAGSTTGSANASARYGAPKSGASGFPKTAGASTGAFAGASAGASAKSGSAANANAFAGASAKSGSAANANASAGVSAGAFAGASAKSGSAANANASARYGASAKSGSGLSAGVPTQPAAPAAELDGDKIVRRDAKKVETEDSRPVLRKGGKGKRPQYDALNDDERDSGNRRRSPAKGDRRLSVHHYVDSIEIDDDSSEDERYRQMALVAEQLQRERVIADARAAIEAAETEGGGRRRKRKEKRVAEAKERAELKAIEKGLDPALALDSSIIQLTSGVTVQGFADALSIPSKDIVKKLFLLGSPFTVTQTMPDELVELIAKDYDIKIRIVSPEEEYSIQIHDNLDDLKPRPPVVTVMGHVDHGKTSLLDAIRSTGVVATEAGGITQHIGASVAEINGRQITFIDTPGHEAFTAMRARGAKVTDVVVLVVAADDGVMPQTVEAVNHAQAAGVPIVVAVNKIDKPSATPERVRQELTEHGIIPEEWGGQNMFVDVSAKMRLGIDDLLELILLQADVLELKANPHTIASGFVIEAKLDKGRGPVATVLVQRGTLKVGDAVVVGASHGRVRALINPFGKMVDNAYPADPVEILGLGSIPDAGDEFRVFADERDARNLAEDRALRQRLSEHQKKSRASLEDLFSRIEQNKLSELNLVVKADVQGSIEALSDALGKMDQSEVRINVIHSAVGGITETDVMLAVASDAIVIGFNVRPTAKAKTLADKEQVEIKTYRIIYQAIEEINAARVGLLSPNIIERGTGMAEVRELFKVPRVGTIAGCMIIEGEISRDDRIRIVREGTVIHEGSLASLRRFKEDVKTVRAGYECGISVDNYQDLKLRDILEAYKVTEIAREA